MGIYCNIFFIACNSNNPPNADLSIENFSVDKTTVARGEQIEMTALVKNQGNIDASSTIKFYQSSNNIIESNDRFLTMVNIPTLTPDATNTLIGSYIATGDEGNFYFGACIDIAIYERTKNNNCSSGINVLVSGDAAPITDLIITSVTTDITDTTVGENIAITTFIHNRGTANTTRYATLRFFQSSDNSITNNDSLFSPILLNIPSLPVNAFARISNLFQTSSAGSFYIGVCIELIDEDIANNNCGVGPRITITPTTVTTLAASLYSSQTTTKQPTISLAHDEIIKIINTNSAHYTLYSSKLGNSFDNAIRLGFTNNSASIASYLNEKEAEYYLLEDATGDFIISTISKIDTFCSLYDNHRRRVLSNDDSKKDSNCRIFYSLREPKNFYIKVEGFNMSIKGSYQLLIRRKP